MSIEVPLRDRVLVSGHLDSLNDILPGTPLTLYDVIGDQGGSGYKLAPAPEQLVIDQVTELLAHRVGSGSPVSSMAWAAIYFFKVPLILPVEEGVPDVEDIELTPKDAVVDPQTMVIPTTRKPKTKHRI